MNFEFDKNDDRRAVTTSSSNINVSELTNFITAVLYELQSITFPTPKNISWDYFKNDDIRNQDRWEDTSYVIKKLLELLNFDSEKIKKYNAMVEFNSRLTPLFYDPERFAIKLSEIYWKYHDNGKELLKIEEQATEVKPGSIDTFILEEELEELEENVNETDKNMDISNTGSRLENEISENSATIEYPFCTDAPQKTESFEEAANKLTSIDQGITHFLDTDLQEIHDFHKRYKKSLNREIQSNDDLKNGFDDIQKDIKKIGYNNMLCILYCIKDDKRITKNISPLDFLLLFLFVVFTYTTPLYYEFFLLFFPLGHNDDENSFMPAYTDIRPIIYEYINKTDINADIDYFNCLTEYFELTLTEDSRFQKQIQWIDNLKYYYNKSTLPDLLNRFRHYRKIESEHDNNFKFCLDSSLLIVHMIYLFEKPWIFMEHLRNLNLLNGQYKHLKRILDIDEYNGYMIHIEKK